MNPIAAREIERKEMTNKREEKKYEERKTSESRRVRKKIEALSGSAEAATAAMHVGSEQQRLRV